MLTGQMMIEMMTAGPTRPTVGAAALAVPVVDIPRIPDPGVDAAGRPVVAVDLDGVLNALGVRARAEHGVRLVDTVIPAWSLCAAAFLNGRAGGTCRLAWPWTMLTRLGCGA